MSKADEVYRELATKDVIATPADCVCERPHDESAFDYLYTICEQCGGRYCEPVSSEEIAHLKTIPRSDKIARLNACRVICKAHDEARKKAG